MQSVTSFRYGMYSSKHLFVVRWPNLLVKPQRGRFANIMYKEGGQHAIHLQPSPYSSELRSSCPRRISSHRRTSLLRCPSSPMFPLQTRVVRLLYLLFLSFLFLCTTIVDGAQYNSVSDPRLVVLLFCGNLVFCGVLLARCVASSQFSVCGSLKIVFCIC